VLENYLPILVFLAVGGLIGVVLLVLGFVLGPRRPAGCAEEFPL